MAQAKKAGFAPARRGIQAQGSAKQQRQGGIRHGVGVNGGWGARRNHAEKERQKKARSKYQHSTRPVFARHGCRRGNAGQEQNIQPDQALPFIKLARYALEEIGNQAGCRVGKARRQLMGSATYSAARSATILGARPQAVNSSHWVNMGCCKANSTHKKQLPPTKSKKPGLNSARRIARHRHAPQSRPRRPARPP